MRIRASCAGRALRLYFDGELDHHAAKRAMGEIEGYIDSRLPRDCVIDLGGLTFMDSSGIAVILKAYRRMHDIGGRLGVERVTGQPRRVIDAAGIERLISIA
ncbi:MAG: STAS domain-containing protein [Oscillospiraceae bacterium]|nr:STAS domain-containing protein [Oscillospiraceae bacterium]